MFYCLCGSCSICFKCFQVTKSVETVVSDVKQKYDEAQKQVQDASAGIAQAEADLALIQKVQQQIMEEIKRLCQ